MERKQKPVRFTEDQERRILRVLKKRGVTYQTYTHAAIMRAVGADEAEIREKDGERGRGDGEARRDAEDGGLGIRAALLAEAHPATADQPATAPTVVVNAGGGGEAPDLVEKLAASVASGPRWEREARLRRAVDAIKALTDSEEEREAAARKLDERVATLEKRAGRTPTSDATFDKLKHFLGFDR